MKHLYLFIAFICLTCGNGFAQTLVTINSPNSGSTVTSPVQVSATAASSRSISSWRVYVDSSLVYRGKTGNTLKVAVPMTAGTHKLTVRAYTTGSNYGSAATTATVMAVPTAPLPLQITTVTVASATEKAVYSSTLGATGGTAPYSWSLVSGSLPAGLSLSSSGVISGTPTAVGTFYFSVMAKDSAGTQQAATSALSITVNAATAAVLWKAGFETASDSEWYAPSTSATGSYGGGQYNSGTAKTVASTVKPRSGAWSGEMTISTPSSPSSGTRMFRWKEARSNREAYYSVWMYIPTKYALTGDPANGHYWNLFQFKSRTADNSRIDPLWALYVDDSNGGYKFKAGWGWGGTPIAGPYSTSNVSGKWYYQSAASIPIGRWFHVETFLRQSNGFDGRMTVWQDGVMIFDFQNIRTSFPNCNYNSWCTANEWAVNNYSDGLSPNPGIIYIDDAAISTSYIP